MSYFFTELELRSNVLHCFGWVCVLLSALFIFLAIVYPFEVAGANAWIKPLKFSLSTVAYSWAMTWFIGYLPNFNKGLFSWSVVFLLGFEIVYIAIQASKGQLSHFNLSSPVYVFLYSCMAIAASAVTIYTAYIGVLFLNGSFPALPPAYLFGIRAGIFLFVIFAFEGFVMGGRLSHTIGASFGGAAIPFLNWSRTYGDPRVAHFIGMHALQVLPLICFYVIKDLRFSVAIAAVYAILALYTLLQALAAKPFIS
jgi:hypothetical protein